MDTNDFLAALARESAAFRVAAVSAGFGAPVPSCPGWTVADLVWHLAEVHQFWGFIVMTRAADPSAYVEPERCADDELLAVFDTNLAALTAVLSTTPADTTVWTWAKDHSVGFVQRRMAHETAVHRWDAESAAGTGHRIEATLASDGIDEFLEHVFASRVAIPEAVGGSVHIHCGDVPGEWTVRPTTDGFEVTREHAKGDCALRGDASDLLLALWRRTGLDSIDVVGDQAVAQRFVATTVLD
jgi:uncharacterized protein (TIGR03083 family)